MTPSGQKSTMRSSQAVLPLVTRRQRKVIESFRAEAAITSESACLAQGWDAGLAEKLASRGILNKRFDADRGWIYWIRAADEPATGTLIEVGFVAILHRDLATPSGRAENFFLARATYDVRGVTFRRLLRGWMSTLGLRPRDLVGGVMRFEMVPADSPMFEGDHVVLGAASSGQEPLEE